MVANNVKTKSELMRLALRRSENGDNDLHAFILNRTRKALADLIETTWTVQDAPKAAERESKSRIGIIEETAKGPCECKGEWLRCAEEVLAKNKINIYVFAHAIRQCLISGRRKNTNVLLIGPTNGGKSFLLNPIDICQSCHIQVRMGWVR